MPVLYKLTNPSLHAKSRLGFFDLLYPIVADRPGLQPFINLCSAARHCEIRPTTCKNLLSSDFRSVR